MNCGNQLRHVAIIMDGNNRWAKREGRQGVAGHRAGAERIREVLRACRTEGVQILTLFAFSSENWRRPPREVEALMGLFHSYLQREAVELASEGVRLKVIGSRERFSARLRATIERAEATAASGDRTLVIAADYGGQWDIAQAAARLAERAVAGEIQPGEIDAQAIDQELSTHPWPPVDLLIRTGGELRISNFLLWQSAYAELYFTPLLWPEFDGPALAVAAAEYRQRQRRFGRTGAQLEQAGQHLA